MATKIQANARGLGSVGIVEQEFDGSNGSLAKALRGLAQFLDNDPFVTVMSIQIRECEDGTYLDTLLDSWSAED